MYDGGIKIFNLLQAELKMFKNNQIFWGLVIFLFLIYVFGRYNNIYYNQHDEIKPLAQSIISFTYSVAMSIIVLSIFTKDIKNRTINNIIITGKHKWQIYFSKVIILLIAVIVFQVITQIISRFTYYVSQSDFSEDGLYVQLLLTLCDCLYAIMILGVCILINVITYNFIATIVLSCVIFAIISIIEAIPNNTDIFKNVIKFLPNHLYISVFVNPFTKESILRLIYVSILVFIITSLLGYLIFKIRDFR